MSWQLYRWVWQLCSPLHIGTTPAGSLNRTRLYIPARNMWAALTAEIARRRAATSFPDYQQIGEMLREHARFSYLFPAEKVHGSWYAWLPRYQTNNGASGLFWYREDGGAAPVPDRRFRQRLLDTRLGTAIAPGSNTAEDATLREFEYVMPFWRLERSEKGYSAPQPVAFVGYCFLRNTGTGTIQGDVTQICEILIGGESRYGFGRLSRVQWEQEDKVFGVSVDLNNQDPLLQGLGYLLAHASLSVSAETWGDWEVLVRWDWQTLQGNNSPVWRPGTKIRPANFIITPDGLWQVQ